MSISQNFSSIKPSLNLDFANTKTLDPRITFSRPTGAVYYDGKSVTKAEENLLLRSQEFDNASWTKGNITVTANSEAAPDGTVTADVITLGDSSVLRSVNQYVAQPNLTYSGSVFVKKPTSSVADKLRVTFNNGSAWNTGISILVTLTTEWQRIEVPNCLLSIGGGIRIVIGNIDASNSIDTSVIAGDVAIWGAQLEQRSTVTAYTPTTTQPITNYIPTLLSAPADTARFDHDPVTGESLGLLVEEQRTNLQTYSEDFSNVAWVKNNATVTADTIIAPDGTLSGNKLVENTSTDLHLIYQSKTVTATSHTATVYAKSGGRNWLRMDLTSASTVGAFFDLENVAVGTVTAGYTASITSVGNGWCRCSLTTTTTATLWYVQIFSATANGTVSYTGNGYSGIYIWGAQLEAGSFPTSYIKTEASQVTRSADSASMTGANFSDWYRQDEGSIYSEAKCTINPSINFVGSFSDSLNSNANYIDVARYQTTLKVFAASSGASQVAFNTGITSSTSHKVAGRYKTNDFAISVDGANALTDTVAIIPLVNRLYIGSVGSQYFLNGTIKRIAYYPTHLSNLQLQSLTS